MRKVTTLKTDLQIKAISAIDVTSQYQIDGNGRLQLRVSPRGTKSFRYRMKPLGEKETPVTIGRHPDLTINQAKRLSRDIQYQVEQGKSSIWIKDWLTKKNDQKDEVLEAIVSDKPLFKDYYQEWYDREKHSWKSETHKQQAWNATITYTDKYFWHKSIDLITINDILECFNQPYGDGTFWQNCTETAKKLMGRLNTIFDLMVLDEIRADNPIPSIKRNSSYKLGRPARRKQTQGFVDPFKINELFNLLPPDFLSRVLATVMLTSKRVNEVSKLKWQHVNFDYKTIAITDTKTGDTDTFPISSTLLEILKFQYEQRLEGRDWVFDQGKYSDKGFELNAPLNKLKRVLGDRRQYFTDPTSKKLATAHGFRTTFRTWAGNIGYDHTAAEKQLTHKLPKIIETYMKSPQLETRRIMLQHWDDVITGKARVDEVARI